MATQPKLTVPKVTPGGAKAIAAANIPGRASSTRTNLLNNPPAGSQDTGGPVKITNANKPAAVAASPPTPAQGGSTIPASTPAAAISPFLTPDQTAAFNTAWNNYQGALTSDQQNLGNAQVDEKTSIANDKTTAIQNSSTENNAAASRGLFNSSIHDGALNDIAATQASNDNIALTNLSRVSDSINSDMTRLNNNWGATATGFAGDAVTNAQAQTPVLTPANPAAQSYTAPSTPTGATIKPGGILGAGAAASNNIAPSGSLSSVGSNAGNKAVAQTKSKQSLAAGLTNAGKALKGLA